MKLTDVPTPLTKGDPEPEVIRTLIFLKEYGVVVKWEQYIVQGYSATLLTGAQTVIIGIPQKPTHMTLYSNKDEEYNMDIINLKLAETRLHEEHLESLKPNPWSSALKDRWEKNINPPKDKPTKTSKVVEESGTKTHIRGTHFLKSHADKDTPVDQIP
jgi:hypothetical protein